MLNLKKVFKNYEEVGALNEHINLYGFISDNMFLTKSGDIGIVLKTSGIDYEGLDEKQYNNITRMLRAGFKVFDETARIYQYFIKRSYKLLEKEFEIKQVNNPVVDNALKNRTEYFNQRLDNIYSIEIYFVILIEARKEKLTFLNSIKKIVSGDKTGIEDIKALFSNEKFVFLYSKEIEQKSSLLLNKVKSFINVVSDILDLEILHKDEAFKFLFKLLNYTPYKVANAKRKYDTFLDYYVSNSTIDAYRNYLQVDDFYLKVLTLKEPPSYTAPNLFRQLAEIPGNFILCTEFKRESNFKVRKEIQSKRRHFHNAKTSLQVQLQDNVNPGDYLVDDSKEALIGELGEAIKELELEGNYFGLYSLTALIFDEQKENLEKIISNFYKVFASYDAVFFNETYNILNAYFSVVPGNYHFNLRYMYILNTNYADLSFIYTIKEGEQFNKHLKDESLALLESNHNTVYHFNLHYLDLAHTLILGKTGSGKSFLLNFIITNMQKYKKVKTFIFDIGGSYYYLTKQFNGAYVKLTLKDTEFKINPFSLEPTEENKDFLYKFIKSLIENKNYEINYNEEKEIREAIDNIYYLNPDLRTLSNFIDNLPQHLREVLEIYKKGNAYGNFFDNKEDTLTFSDFQAFDFEEMEKFPDVVEPMLFYILHRANEEIYKDENRGYFKAFILDETWRFFKNETIKNYIIEALKTWRKKNAGMIMATQSLDDLKKSAILDIVLESCPTKIFLANPDMDEEVYKKTFKLNDTEIKLVANLIPKKQFLIKRPDLSKVVNLNVDKKSYWIYTSDPRDAEQREKAFNEYGINKGLEILAKGEL